MTLTSHYQYFKIIVAMVAILTLPQACFTGVESTGKITERDVQRAMQEMESRKTPSSLLPYHDSLPLWQPGKSFTIVDNRVRLIFSCDDMNLDTMSLVGKVITFEGDGTHNHINGKEVVDLHFNLDGHRLTYNTGKLPAEVNTASFAIPFIVDNDMVEHYRRQLVGKTFYVKTPMWLSADGNERINGRRFLPVKIVDVHSGNSIYPLGVEFEASDNGQRAMMFMSEAQSAISGHDFDNLFSVSDVRTHYPHITPDTWQLIVNGKVVTGMTKEECQLSLGAPKSINRLPAQSGLREYWYYDGGRYLFFVDGLLKEYR